MTITDADLERLLSLAASEYAVPADGIEAVLAAERAPAAPKVPTRRAWSAPRPRLVVGIAVLAVLGIFIGGVVTAGHKKHGSPTAAGSIGRIPAGAARSGPESMPKFAQGSTAGAAAGAPALAAPSTAPLPGAVGGASSAGGGAAGQAADAGASDAAKIVRTGQADLTVEKGAVPAAQDKLEGLATALGGYVANEKSSGGDYPTASVTIRVPGDRFAELVKQVQTVGKVNDLSTQAADVTGQYTDLGARIHALETQRDTYLTLLAKASSIQETLAVQQRVDAVQTQLEQLQGQLKVLDDQTSYGSLAVSVQQEGQAVITTVPTPRTGFSKAWHDARHRFNGGVQGLVAASGPLAFVALLALAAWLIWLAFRRRWQRARV